MAHRCLLIVGRIGLHCCLSLWYLFGRGLGGVGLSGVFFFFVGMVVGWWFVCWGYWLTVPLLGCLLVFLGVLGKVSGWVIGGLPCLRYCCHLGSRWAWSFPDIPALSWSLVLGYCFLSRRLCILLISLFWGHSIYFLCCPLWRCRDGRFVPDGLLFPFVLSGWSFLWFLFLLFGFGGLLFLVVGFLLVVGPCCFLVSFLVGAVQIELRLIGQCRLVLCCRRLLPFLLRRLR